MKKIILIIFLLPSLSYSQTYQDLLDFPTAESVVKNINESDKTSTLVKKIASLAVLRQFLMLRHSYLKKDLYEDENLKKQVSDLDKIYGEKVEIFYKELFIGIESKEEQQSIRKKYRDKFDQYTYNPSFRDSIKNMLSEKAQEHFFTLDDPIYLSNNNSTQRRPIQHEKTQQPTKFSFDENHQLTPNPIVFETPGISKETLYKRTLIWINKTYKSTYEVIDSKIENDYVKIIGNEILFHGLQDFPYTLDIEFKEGRYRLTFDSVRVVDPKYIAKKYNLSESETIQQNKSLIEGNDKAFKYIENLYVSLNEYLVQKNKKDGDW